MSTYSQRVATTKRYHRRRHTWRRVCHLLLMGATVGSVLVSAMASASESPVLCGVSLFIGAACAAALFLRRDLH